MRIAFSLLFVFILQLSQAQEPSGAAIFWKNLQKHCGQSFEGTMTNGDPKDDFAQKKLVMHVRSCSENVIKIPFFVGDDKSRTWVLTYENDRITLKHDHRHEDGSEDKITQYGGTSSNSGLANLQMFPADPFTCEMIDYACHNVWWITLDENSFAYNLRRIGSDRLFTVSFDLTKTVDNPEAPWGWKE